MAPGEGWEVAARVNYLSPLSSLTFGLIFPDTENKVNHVLWVFYFMCSGRKVQSGQETLKTFKEMGRKEGRREDGRKGKKTLIFLQGALIPRAAFH